MRYIGNKTRLLGFIRSVLRRRGIQAGSAVDPFSGTASVASALKRLGFRVVASDLMEYAYVFGSAYVAPSGMPSFAGLKHMGGKRTTLRSVIAHLNALPPKPGFMHDNFTPAGVEGLEHGRMYFTPDNSARIDVIRATIEHWRGEGRIDEVGYYVLLAALIESADRVANTTGVYASFVKSWQPNARRALELRDVRPIPGAGSRALRGDALEIVPQLDPFDVLYLDPPYNSRQYVGYYHIPELLALGWFGAKPKLRGKTGLLADKDKRSAWSRRGKCEAALEALVASARCRRIVMSYNSEGIIPEAAIERIFKAHGRASTYERYERKYKRYRSDADSAKRRYSGDAVSEYLYCVDR